MKVHTAEPLPERAELRARLAEQRKARTTLETRRDSLYLSNQFSPKLNPTTNKPTKPKGVNMKAVITENTTITDKRGKQAGENPYLKYLEAWNCGRVVTIDREDTDPKAETMIEQIRKAAKTIGRGVRATIKSETTFDILLCDPIVRNMTDEQRAAAQAKRAETLALKREAALAEGKPAKSKKK